MKKLILGLAMFITFARCGGAGDAPRNDSLDDSSGSSVEQDPMSDNLIGQIIQSIPSPIEISFIIKDVSDLYNKRNLNDYESVEKYDTQFKKALNLGIYGTDMGYANIYSKTQDALKYLSAVRDLANGLSIGQFFDYNTIKKLAENANQLDSLLAITQSNMEDINYHLRQQKRESLSILLIVGGWVEATYLTISVYKQTRSELLMEKIGEQKVVLDQILLVLDIYRTRPDFPELIADLKEMEKIYREIDIQTIYKEPTIIEKNDVLTVVDNSETVIKINHQHVQRIDKILEKIRNNIIS